MCLLEKFRRFILVLYGFILLLVLEKYLKVLFSKVLSVFGENVSKYEL